MTFISTTAGLFSTKLLNRRKEGRKDGICERGLNRLHRQRSSRLCNPDVLLLFCFFVSMKQLSTNRHCSLRCIVCERLPFPSFFPTSCSFVSAKNPRRNSSLHTFLSMRRCWLYRLSGGFVAKYLLFSSLILSTAASLSLSLYLVCCRYGLFSRVHFFFDWFSNDNVFLYTILLLHISLGTIINNNDSLIIIHHGSLLNGN